MKRPEVEDFKRLSSPESGPWGMADSDTVDLCNYILYLEDALKEIASGLSVCDPFEIANEALGRVQQGAQSA